jgi:SAM-dependent methyltransferase
MEIILGFLLIITLVFAVAAVSGAPWVPAFKRDLEAVLDDSALKPNELFVELGCGDGRLLAAAAKRGSRAIGYEINPLLYVISLVRTWKHRKLVTIKLRNFWSADISNADVVMVFLVPRTMPRLKLKINKEMKKGARLVSYIFELHETKPLIKRHHWLVYKI